MATLFKLVKGIASILGSATATVCRKTASWVRQMALAMQGYAGGSFDPGSSNLFDLHVQCMTGEELLLKVSPSMLGRRVRQLVLQKLASKRGAKLLLHHGSAALALNQTLQEQGIVSETKTLSALSATYMPANLYAAACFLQGLSTSEEAL